MKNVLHDKVGAFLVIMANKLDPTRLWLVGPAISTQDEGMIVGADQNRVA
jgi:hypothetical protein